jgi:hypothetical protein
MGVAASKKDDAEKRLAYNIRKQNCKITKRIYKIIEDAYKSDYLTEYEYHATIGWYYGMKFRHQGTEDEVFVAALDKINDFVCTTIQERYAQYVQDHQMEELLPATPARPALNDKDLQRFRKIIKNSPYDRIPQK